MRNNRNAPEPRSAIETAAEFVDSLHLQWDADLPRRCRVVSRTRHLSIPEALTLSLDSYPTVQQQPKTMNRPAISPSAGSVSTTTGVPEPIFDVPTLHGAPGEVADWRGQPATADTAPLASLVCLDSQLIESGRVFLPTYHHQVPRHGEPSRALDETFLPADQDHPSGSGPADAMPMHAHPSPSVPSPSPYPDPVRSNPLEQFVLGKLQRVPRK